MTTFPIEPLNIAQCVCKRPRMYTANGTLAEVLALFEGYNLALRYGSSPAKDTSPAHVLKWLAGELGEDVVWPEERVTWLLERFQSEAAALSEIERVASTADTT